jgi:hypothetical protein
MELTRSGAGVGAVSKMERIDGGTMHRLAAAAALEAEAMRELTLASTWRTWRWSTARAAVRRVEVMKTLLNILKNGIWSCNECEEMYIKE